MYGEVVVKYGVYFSSDLLDRLISHRFKLKSNLLQFNYVIRFIFVAIFLFPLPGSSLFKFSP